MTFAAILRLKYSPDQPRDDNGRWTDSGSTSPVASKLREGYSTTTTGDEVVHSFPSRTQMAVRQAKERIKAAVQAGQETKQRFSTKTASGNLAYTQQRLELHHQILKAMFSPQAVAAAKPAPGQDPTVYFLGGRGGSGKSQFAGEVYDPKKAIVIDPDAIKEALGKADGGYEGWEAYLYHEESSDLGKQAVAMARHLKVNVVIDQTMNGDPKHKIAEFRQAGYRVEGHYMFLPEQMAARRAVGRFENGGDFKGRFVPPDVVLSNTENEKHFDKNIPQFDKWSVWRNDVPKGQRAIRVAQGSK